MEPNLNYGAAVVPHKGCRAPGCFVMTDDPSGICSKHRVLETSTPNRENRLCDKLSEGRKDDQDKIRMELLPPELLEQTAQVLTFGAKKYSDRNWEKGMAWSRPYGALMRHLWAWWRKEPNDPETGYSHLAHAACCLAFLMGYESRKVGQDDRP